MNSKLKKVKLNISRYLGDKFIVSPKIYKHENHKSEPRKILVVGVVLQDRDNHYGHISKVLDSSIRHDVQQLWAVLKSKIELPSSENIMNIYFDEFIPRFKLINSIIREHSEGNYDYIIVTDDDIRLPEDFLDQFIMRQEQCDFSLAQPARTLNSITSHAITTQEKNTLARQTRFVEIGPLISIRRDAQKIILPFDESSPMGWGLDYVWPALLDVNNLKMGIVDCVPIAHTLRPVGVSYDSSGAMKEMREFLLSKVHLLPENAQVVLKKIKN